MAIRPSVPIAMTDLCIRFVKTNFACTGVAPYLGKRRVLQICSVLVDEWVIYCISMAHINYATP